MKKLFTLAAAGLLAATGLDAQAQIAVDGVLNAAEISTTNYRLIGKFTNARGFGDYGLLSLYAANTPTKLYFFVAGTVEGNGNALQLFLSLPGVTGASASPTALPTATGSGTSFQNMSAKLDFGPNLALALKGNGTPNNYQVETINYTSATAATDRILTTTAAPLVGTGAPLTLSSTTTVAPYNRLAGAVMAYRNTTDGKVLTNPGNTANPTTNPAYGAAGSFGWEIELDRSNMGLLTGTPRLTILALQNNNDGGFLSTDYIPQGPNATAANLGSSPDFGAIPGRQAADIVLGLTGVLGNKAADASVAMSVYPNPANGVATVEYNVAERAQAVSITLTDLLGRPVRVLESGLRSAGAKTTTVSTADVAAGSYLVRVQVGENVATRKVVLL